MPIVDMRLKLQTIEMFLTRAISVEDECTQVFHRGYTNGDWHEELEWERAGDLLLGYQDIVIRATLGELNALVELELKHLAWTILEKKGERRKRKEKLGRGTARRIIEEHYDIKLDDLPRFAEVDRIRKVVNAYKHDNGFSSEYTFVPERYELEWEKALCSVEAVREFLQALPGDRATLGDSVVRFLSKR
jgi:hypothetical protein